MFCLLKAAQHNRKAPSDDHRTYRPINFLLKKFQPQKYQELFRSYGISYNGYIENLLQVYVDWILLKKEGGRREEGGGRGQKATVCTNV